MASLRTKALKASFDLRHLCLGHVAFSIIFMLNKLGHLSVTSILLSPGVCSSCQLAKVSICLLLLMTKVLLVCLIWCILICWGGGVHLSQLFIVFVIMLLLWMSFPILLGFSLRAKLEFYGTFV